MIHIQRLLETRKYSANDMAPYRQYYQVIVHKSDPTATITELQTMENMNRLKVEKITKKLQPSKCYRTLTLFKIFQKKDTKSQITIKL